MTARQLLDLRVRRQLILDRGSNTQPMPKLSRIEELDALIAQAITDGDTATRIELCNELNDLLKVEQKRLDRAVVQLYMAADDHSRIALN